MIERLRSAAAQEVAIRGQFGSRPAMCLLLAVILTTWSGGVASADDPSSIDAFLGEWKGAEVTSAIESLAPDVLELRVQATSDGFRIAWKDLGPNARGGIGGDDLDAMFLPTDRPGVYEYAPKSGSLLERMFASPATGNPLKGETLLWARVDGPLLAVYSMRIDPDGGFDLDHYSWTRIESGLRLTFSKRTEDGGSEVMIEGELAAEGG